MWTGGKTTMAERSHTLSAMRLISTVTVWATLVYSSSGIPWTQEKVNTFPGKHEPEQTGAVFTIYTLCFKLRFNCVVRLRLIIVSVEQAQKDLLQLLINLVCWFYHCKCQSKNFCIDFRNILKVAK